MNQGGGATGRCQDAAGLPDAHVRASNTAPQRH
eukprot:COSAG06_NODE_33316_length_491_cov_57.428571_1_plen_32_part_01